MTHTPTGYAHHGAVRIAYDDLGGAGGDPLLLVMGMAVTRFWWPDGFVEELIRHGFHVVCYDNRDSGQSSRFPAENAGPVTSLFRRRPPAYTAEDLTNDAVAVMDAVGWDSAHLFGHSMGGLIAQRIALGHPDRVRGLALSGSVSSDATRLQLARYIRFGRVLRIARMREAHSRVGDIALSMAVVREMASPGYPFDEREALARVAKDDTSPLRDVSAQGRQLGAHWSGARLSALSVPAVVLHGEADPLLRVAAARDLAKAITGARLVTFPGVGHELPRALWAEYAGLVQAVAASHSSGNPRGR